MVRHTSLVLLSVIRFSILNQLSHADFQFGPGELTKAILREARDNVVNNNEYVRSFDWFIEAVQLFNFRTHDNIIIQAYFIDQPSNSESCEVEVKPVIVHCAGYTETSIKYMDYFNQLHRLGYKVFSFDLRGQGFSGFTGDYDNGSTTHMISLNDSYVADLMYFISTYVYPISNNIIFSGNSLGGLIGLTLQAQRQYFQKLILFAPCIRPKIGTWLEYAISFAHYLGFDKYLPTRFDADLSRVLLTHSESKLRGWVTLRKLFPKYLIITGPTFRWLHELLRASWNILRVSKKRYYYIENNINLFFL